MRVAVVELGWPVGLGVDSRQGVGSYISLRTLAGSGRDAQVGRLAIEVVLVTQSSHGTHGLASLVSFLLEALPDLRRDRHRTCPRGRDAVFARYDDPGAYRALQCRRGRLVPTRDYRLVGLDKPRLYLP